jgi:predicted membrane channel-forming protein YqfA (hemolysin III family)
VIAHPPPEPSWRKPAGMLLILLLIAVWAGIIVAAADTIGSLHIVVQTIIYLVAGTVWILPLKPLLRWMETGKWRTP